MTFSEAEKKAITSIWAKAAGDADDIGAEALERLFLSYPETKTYFSHVDLSHNSKDLHKHGGKIVKAIGNATQHLDNINHAVPSLSDLHAEKLMVDPGNFLRLAGVLKLTMAARFPGEFNAAVQAAWDKFLSAVSGVLDSKYR